MTDHRPARALLRHTLASVRRDVAACLVAGLVWQGVAVATPWVLEQAVDAAVLTGDAATLWRWAGLLVVFGVVAWVSDMARHWWVERAGAHAADSLRRRLVDRLLELDDERAAQFGQGDLIARAVGDTEKVWYWVAGLATFVTATFTLVATVVLLVTLDPALALVGLATVPLAALYAVRQVSSHGHAASDAANASGRYAGSVESAIAGVRTVKGLGAEHVALERAIEHSTRLADRALHLARVESTWLAMATAIPAAGIAVGLWLGGTRVLDGDLQVGALVAFAAWMGLLVDATVVLTDRLAARGSARAAAARLAEVLDNPGDGERHSQEAAWGPATEDAAPSAGSVALPVTLRDVEVGRGARSLLRHVDLDLAAGSWVALVGATGAGKSSLLRVVAGSEAPWAGTVEVGGDDLPRISSQGRRSLVTLVPQGSTMVSGALADVLRLAAPRATDAELLAALDAAAAADIVAELGGLGGRVGDRGLSLSGGQRQRLALAMAVARQPPVLLLDDTTAALDPATEAHVLATLRAALPHSTVVVATHRAGTAGACDRAFLVADGSVTELGDAGALAPLGSVETGP